MQRRPNSLPMNLPPALRGMRTGQMVYARQQMALSGVDGFSLKKLVKKVGKVAKSVAKVAAAPVLAPINIVKDVAQKGLVKGLKAAPSRLLVDPFKAQANLVTSTAKVFTSNDRTIVGKLTGQADKSAAQLQTWTQKHPLQTIGGAALAVGAVIAAPAAIAAAGSAASAIGSGTTALLTTGGAGSAALKAGASLLGSALPKPPAIPTTPITEQAMAYGGPTPTYDVPRADPTAARLPDQRIVQAGMFGSGNMPIIVGGLIAAGLVVYALGSRK
jgi:hypothetical protein